MGRESQSKKKETKRNLGGKQMDTTNRKCIFGNDLLQWTQSNVVFSAATAVTVGFIGHN